MNFLLLISISFIWGSSFILTKKAALCFDHLSIAAYRVLAGAAILWVIWQVGKSKRSLSKADIFPLILLSVIAYAIPFSIQPFLIARYESGFVSLVVCFIPLLTILVSIPMLKKLPNRFELSGVIGGLFFIILLFKDGLERNFSFKHLLLWMIVPLCYSFGNTLVKMKFQHLRPLSIACLALSLSGLILFPASFTESIHINQHFPLAISSLIILGVIGTGLTTAMFYILIHRTGPVSAGMIGYLVPIVALLWGWLDGEPVTWLQVIALVGILSMVALAQRKPAENT